MTEQKTKSKSKSRLSTQEVGFHDCLAPIAQGLALRVPAIRGHIPEVLEALHEALEGNDRESIAMRMRLQMHLVRVSSGLSLQAASDDLEMISTEQAATMMKCSRPYVAMLVDRGKLVGACKTPGGHRKIPLSSVHAWIQENMPKDAQSTDYRGAARDAGMYDVPEKTYTKLLKRNKGSNIG